MNEPNFRIEVENATSLDWLELKRAHGDGSVERPDLPNQPDALSPFKEPVSTTILITIAIASSVAFVAWVSKQRQLQRTALKITVTSPDGTVTKIDLSDKRYAEGDGDTKLITDLVSAGLKASSGAS